MNLKPDNVEELFALSRILESYSVKLAALKNKKQELKFVTGKLNQFYTYLNCGKISHLSRLDSEFHSCLYSLSGRPKLIKMVDDLRNHMLPIRSIMFKIDNIALKHNLDHSRVLFAILQKDERKAEKIIEKHIMTEEKIVLRELGRS